ARYYSISDESTARRIGTRLEVDAKGRFQSPGVPASLAEPVGEKWQEAVSDTGICFMLRTSSAKGERGIGNSCGSGSGGSGCPQGPDMTRRVAVCFRPKPGKASESALSSALTPGVGSRMTRNGARQTRPNWRP